ncbi:hypothetical protein HMI54_004063 [Coelomomyces lativittatus]|nr:hypothetical protein HMI54_004063 [Coelomomyces lativittatus]
MVVFDDYYRYSIHTLLNYNFIIMRENHLFDWVHNNEFITVQPGEKAGQPQKREAETNTEVKVSATNPSNGNNIRRKPEVNTRDAATFIPAKPGKTKNQDSSPVVNIPKADTTKNHKNTFFPPKIQTTTTPVIPPTVVNVEKPNLTKIDTKAPLPPKNTHVPIVSSPVVNDKKPWRNTYGPNRLYNQRRNTQGNGVQPGATNPKKNEPIKPEPNVVSHDKLEYEELLKKRKKAVKDGWRSGRQVDFEKLGLGLPGKFSAASETSKPIATRNLMKRQVGQKRFYDVAFTLGRMAEITNPRHAEQYIADVVNMLQWYYKKFYFNGFSVRLSGAHYLLHHKTLIDFQGLPQIDKGQYYHGVWRNQAFYYSPFKTFDMKFLLSRNLKKSGFFWNGIADIMYYHCNRNNMWGITYIRDDSVTNPYEIVTTLVHEIGHVTGMDHEGKSGCGHEGKTMQSGRSNYIPWRGFSQCSLGKMLCKPQ